MLSTYGTFQKSKKLAFSFIGKFLQRLKSNSVRYLYAENIYHILKVKKGSIPLWKLTKVYTYIVQYKQWNMLAKVQIHVMQSKAVKNNTPL